VSRTCFDILWPFIKINLCQQFNLEYNGKTDTANELYISTNKKSLKPGTPFQSKNPPLALISSRIPSGPYRKQYESHGIIIISAHACHKQPKLNSTKKISKKKI
jgi:hypothetical protein